MSDYNVEKEMLIPPHSRLPSLALGRTLCGVIRALTVSIVGDDVVRALQPLLVLPSGPGDPQTAAIGSCQSAGDWSPL